jgi:hypothetical protein
MIQRQLVSIAGLVAVVATLVGCTEDAPPPAPSGEPTTTRTEAAAPSPQLINPVSLITDPDSDDFVAESVNTLLDEQGSGPSTWTVSLPEGADELRFYVACLPEDEFTVRVKEQFYSGPCTQRFLNWGQFPITGNDPVEVSLEIPSGVDYWLVALPMENTHS